MNLSDDNPKLICENPIFAVFLFNYLFFLPNTPEKFWQYGNFSLFDYLKLLFSTLVCYFV